MRRRKEIPIDRTGRRVSFHYFRARSAHVFFLLLQQISGSIHSIPVIINMPFSVSIRGQIKSGVLTMAFYRFHVLRQLYGKAAAEPGVSGDQIQDCTPADAELCQDSVGIRLKFPAHRRIMHTMTGLSFIAFLVSMTRSRSSSLAVVVVFPR